MDEANLEAWATILLLSRFSRVRLCDPMDGSPQAPLSLRFSRQEYWSGLPFPSPMHKVKSQSEVSVVSDSVQPHGLPAAYQAPPSMGFSRQEYWSGVPLPSPWATINRYKNPGEIQDRVPVTNWELDRYELNVGGDSGSREGKEGKCSLDYPLGIDGMWDKVIMLMPRFLLR